MKSFLIISLLICASDQQNVNVSILEKDLQVATNLAIAKQSKVLSTLLSCKASAAIASSNLKASNFSKDLTNTLDDLANFTLQLLTLKEFESPTTCQNISTCECITFRIVQLDSQIKKTNEVIECIKTNSSTLNELFSKLTWSYSLTYKPILNIWTKEVAVIKTCNQARLTLNELWDLNRIVNLIKKYFIDVKSYLTSELSFCNLTSSSFQDVGIKIDENLRAYQDQLLNLTAIALEKVNISLNTVSSSKKVQAGLIDSRKALKELFESLRKEKTCDDHDWPNITWPRIVS